MASKHPSGPPMTLGNMRPEPDLREHQRLIIRAQVQILARGVERMAAIVDRMEARLDDIAAQLDQMHRVEDDLIEVAEAFRD